MKNGFAALLVAGASLTAPATAATVLAAALTGLAVSPAATADPAGCLPLNGDPTDAHANETNKLGIFYDIDVSYWYQDGAVNWRRNVNGPFGGQSSGVVPVAPGNTATIPGDYKGTPLFVTVCSK